MSGTIKHLNIVADQSEINSDNSQQDIKPLLQSAYSAEEGSFESLFQLIYRDLKNIARHRLSSERNGHTLQATALVHEAFLRLSQGDTENLKDRTHLLALTSRIMRNVLVDYARKRNAKKNHSPETESSLEPIVNIDPEHQVNVLDLDKALTRMEEDLSRLVRVVECKFFACMTNSEIAESFEVSERTIERDWDRARAHLMLAMRDDEAES